MVRATLASLSIDRVVSVLFSIVSFYDPAASGPKSESRQYLMASFIVARDDRGRVLSGAKQGNRSRHHSTSSVFDCRD